MTPAPLGMCVALGWVWPHLVALELPWQPPVKRLRVDMLPDSHGVQEDIGGLVIHPSGRAPEVTLRNHTQKGLI